MPGGKTTLTQGLTSVVLHNTMTQNTRERNNERLVNVVMEATSHGRAVTMIGTICASKALRKGIKLRLADRYDYTIPTEALTAMEGDGLFVIGRPGGHCQLDASIVPPSGMIDTRVSRIQCFARRVGNSFIIFDCSINGTKLVC